MGFLGGSLAYAWQQLNTWRGRANQAWGATRDWNNGVSWEASYNNAQAAYTAEIALYNDQVAQTGTWTARANQAWGASRVWPSGESWEAAYARVLPPASLQLLTAGPTALPNVGFAYNAITSVTANRSGDWHVTIAGTISGGGGASAYGINVSTIGTVFAGRCDSSGTSTMDAHVGGHWRGNVPAGTVFTMMGGTDAGNTSSLTMEAEFIPNATNPH